MLTRFLVKNLTHGYVFECNKRLLDDCKEVYGDPTYGEPKPQKWMKTWKNFEKSVGIYHHLMIRVLE